MRPQDYVVQVLDVPTSSPAYKPLLDWVTAPLVGRWRYNLDHVTRALFFVHMDTGAVLTRHPDHAAMESLAAFAEEATAGGSSDNILFMLEAASMKVRERAAAQISEWSGPHATQSKEARKVWYNQKQQVMVEWDPTDEIKIRLSRLEKGMRSVVARLGVGHLRGTSSYSVEKAQPPRLVNRPKPNSYEVS